MFEKTASRGVSKATPARTSASRSRAGATSGEWNAQATWKVRAWSPCCWRRAVARSIPGRVPEMTVCRGAFRLAIQTSSGSA